MLEIRKLKFLKKSQKIHKDLYGYSNVAFKGTKIPVEIICKFHGKSFFQIPEVHMRGSGCYDCRNNKIGRALRKPIKIFKREASGANKNRFDYSLVNYINSDTSITIKCKDCLHIFQQIAITHLKSKGRCPNCGYVNPILA